MHLNFEFGAEAAAAVICIEVGEARNYNLLQRIMGRLVIPPGVDLGGNKSFHTISTNHIYAIVCKPLIIQFSNNTLELGSHKCKSVHP